jgi:hypothetical protein
MLKLWIPLLAGLVVVAVLVEAGNGRPCPISSHLTRLRVQERGKRVLVCEHRTQTLQVIGGDAVLIHPVAHTFVPNELCDSHRFINGRVLLLGASDFVLVDQHSLLLLLPFSAKIIPRNNVVCQLIEVYIMPKQRTNIYLTQRQRRQLEKRCQDENLPMAEIIRRALDAYLAWDDPTYRPTPPKPQTRNDFSSPG